MKPRPTAASTTITVREAPYFDSYLGLWLNDQPQYNDDLYSPTSDDYSAAGTSVEDILYPQQGSLMYPAYYANQGYGSTIGNSDGGADLWGIAITGVDTQDGTLQYSPDGGSNGFTSDWQNISPVSDTYALLLDQSDSIRFLPNATFFGDISDAVTFRLWDETSGTAMTYADVSDNGGTTAFSADTATAAVRIDPLVSISGGSGGVYNVSTTSAVPASLVVSGEGTWTGGESLSPFTVTIPAGSKSATINLSALTLSGPWQGLGNGSTSGAYTGTFIASLATADSIAQQVGYASPGYDYAVDPSASGVSATETIGANTVMGFGGVVSTTQSGNTIQVTLYGGVNWSTANGTALAGTDYQSNAGSTPAGDTQTTVDITLENLSALSDTTFFIVTSGGGLSGTFYDPIIIQTIAPQLLADSNNDGRIDATADAAANAAAITNNTGGVLVDPDPGNDPTAPTNDQSSSQYDPANSGLALVTSGRLVEIDLDLYSLQGLGTSVTLTAQGDTSDFAVWTDPSRTMQITVTGSGTTWPTSQAPAQVWVEAPEGGSQGTSAPAITLMLALQNQSSGQPQSSSVRVQAAPILDARVVKDNPTNATFNAPTSVWLSATPTQYEQGPYVPMDNEDLDNNGIPDDQQAAPVATDNLLPIAIRNADGTPITQGGWYQIGGGADGTAAIPTSIRIWLKSGSKYTLVTQATHLSPDATLYIEGVGTKVGSVYKPADPQITLRWYTTATTSVKLLPMTINVFSIVGPRDVPDQTSYQYRVSGLNNLVGTFNASGGISSQSATNPTVTTVTWAAAPNGAWGKVDFTPKGSAYTWAAHVAVVGINFGTMSLTAAGTPAQITGQARVDSTNLWATNSTLMLSQFRNGLTPAMNADLTVTSIVGPTRPGVANPFGVNHIQMGFVQTATITQDQLTYSDSSKQTTSIVGSTLIDVVNKTTTLTSTFTSRFVNPNPAYKTSMLPWYDPLGVTFTGPTQTYTVFQATGQANVGAPTVFHTSDIPSGNGFSLDNRDAVPTALDLSWAFTTMFVVHTIDTDPTLGFPASPTLATAFASMKATNYAGGLNDNAYTIEAQGTWSFNGSGTFENGNYAGQNSVGQPAGAGAWAPIPGTTGVFPGTQLTPQTSVTPLPTTLFVPTAKAPILNNNLP